MTTDPDIEKQIPQKALAKIRALCKGNGAEPDSIQITNARGKIIKCRAITHVDLECSVTEENRAGRQTIGETLDNPQQIEAIINTLPTTAIKNQDTRKYLSDILLKRKDKGFALNDARIPVDSMERIFSSYEPCRACNGQGQSNCQRCGGKRQEVCNKCKGRAMMPCIFCHSRGYTQTPDGKQHQCKRCFGQKQLACTLCRKTGTIPCRQCNGTGTSTCQSCKGNAFNTIITTIKVYIKTLFEIDRNELPEEAYYALINQGGKLVATEHIKMTAEPVRRDDDGLAIEYMTTFPFGNLELSINGKPLKTSILGYKGKMLKLPNFLDKMVTNDMDLLKQAVTAEKGAAIKIRKAANSRIIAEAITLCLSMPPKKAMLTLKKKFPLGASNNFLKDVITTANKALANVTRKTRYSGMGVGMIIAAFIDAAYFMSGARTAILNATQQENVVMLCDLLLIPLGGFIGAMAAQAMAQQPLRKALGPLVPDRARGKFKATPVIQTWPSYAISALTLLAVIYIVKLTGHTPPSWFPL